MKRSEIMIVMHSNVYRTRDRRDCFMASYHVPVPYIPRVDVHNIRSIPTSLRWRVM